MTDTTAESAEAPRTPEERAIKALRTAFPGPGPDTDRVLDAVTPVAEAIRAALAARDAEWVEAVTETFGPLAMEMVMAGTAAHSGALRALLSEGKPGQ